MAKGSNSKFKMIYLAKVMAEQTDEDHYLTMPEIIRALEAYGVSAERKSLYEDLKELDRMGLEIDSVKQGKMTYYHVVGRRFELAEVKLLVDTIQSSRFISANRSRQLIEKLEGLVSQHEAKSLQRQVYVQGRIKSMNGSIYNNVDALHRAIGENKQVSFQYFSWNTKKEAELRHGGKAYVMSPWGLCNDSENYYLIAYDEEAGKKKHFRVDKMKNITVLDSKRVGEAHFQKTDMAAYNQKNFSMFGGEETVVQIKFHRNMANVIIDRFGKEIPIHETEEPDWFRTRVDVAVSDHFFGWVLSLGDGVEIVGPDPVLKQVKTFIQGLSDRYLK